MEDGCKIPSDASFKRHLFFLTQWHFRVGEAGTFKERLPGFKQILNSKTLLTLPENRPLRMETCPGVVASACRFCILTVLLIFNSWETLRTALL